MLEITDGLNGQFALDGGGGVTWLQLDDGLGSFVQACDHGLEFIELLSLLLRRKKYEKFNNFYMTNIFFKKCCILIVFKVEYMEYMTSFLTAASCSRSSSRVAVVERSQLYFFFMFSCIFFILS